jgi:hypothetical protein
MAFGNPLPRAQWRKLAVAKAIRDDAILVVGIFKAF